jgi:nucleotide-binding universal stress UspA family protein
MKNILTLIGGGDRDEVILRTAWAAALPCSSHLDCLHVRVSAVEAARGSPVEFAASSALRGALSRLDADARTCSRVAAAHIREFCERAVIRLNQAVSGRQNGITASYREETDDALERLLAHGHRSDLIVMGRARQTQGLPSYTLSRLISRSGRPMLVAASGAPQKLTGTVLVCWDGSKGAARAVEAAAPILTRATRVIVVSAARSPARAAKTADKAIRRLLDLGIQAEARHIAVDGRGVAVQLSAVAEDCEADLVVTGAYGRSVARELLFGSRTDAIVRQIDRPIFMMH